MLKATFAIALVSLATSAAFAGQRKNFAACKAADSSWMNRWGNYVVAFDRSTAYSKCQSQFPWGPVDVRQAGCYLRGSWVKAGYYCQEVSFGG